MKKIYNIPATEEILVASDLIMQAGVLQGSDAKDGQWGAPSRSLIPGFTPKAL